MTQEPANNEIAEKIDAMARAVSAGFEKTDARLDGLRGDIESLRDDLRDFKKESRSSFAHLAPRTFPSELEREDLEGRVKYIEKQLGIESGK